MRRLAALLLAAACCAAADLPEDVLALSKVRRRAKEILATTPDFVCLANIERFRAAKPGRPPERTDTVRLEVAHVGNRDLFSWPGRNSFGEQSAGELVRHGMIASGDFAAHLRDVFIAGFSTIRFAESEDWNGRRVLRWTYNVPLFGSGYKIVFGSAGATAGSAGSFWADARTGDILRLTVRTTDLPIPFPIHEVATLIDYGPVQVGPGVVAWLPQTAEDTASYADGSVNVNRTEFSHCRRYGAVATISFEPGPAGAPGPEPLASGHDAPSLPGGIMLQLELLTPIQRDTPVGEPIEARLASDVKNKTVLLAAKGAAVRGRLRVLEHIQHPKDSYQVGLEFTEIDLPGGTARFYASMNSIDSAAPGLASMLNSTEHSQHTLPGWGDLHRYSTEIRQVDQIPGVGSFFIEGSRLSLPRGLRMTWITEDVSRRP